MHFKFRSAMEYDSIDIDGPFIAIGGLKEKIVEHKNLRSATDIDLLITNAQTGEGEQVFSFSFLFLDFVGRRLLCSESLSLSSPGCFIHAFSKRSSAMCNCGFFLAV